MSPCLVPHKTWLDTPNIRPSRHICIQVPQPFSNNFHIIMTSWPTSFSIIYNIISPIIRIRISSLLLVSNLYYLCNNMLTFKVGNKYIIKIITWKLLLHSWEYVMFRFTTVRLISHHRSFYLSQFSYLIVFLIVQCSYTEEI